MSNKRKDSKGRVLRKGESERKDGIYIFICIVIRILMVQEKRYIHQI